MMPLTGLPSSNAGDGGISGVRTRGAGIEVGASAVVGDRQNQLAGHVSAIIFEQDRSLASVGVEGIVPVILRGGPHFNRAVAKTQVAGLWITERSPGRDRDRRSELTRHK